jgi:hypothetical protein
VDVRFPGAAQSLQNARMVDLAPNRAHAPVRVVKFYVAIMMNDLRLSLHDAALTYCANFSTGQQYGEPSDPSESTAR